jgi:hypothetical protein
MPKKLDPKIAEARIIKAGAKPLQPFKSVSSKWKCICLKCSNIIYPELENITAGQGACVYCGQGTIHTDKKLEKMLKANLRPLEPYKRRDVGWKSECLVCGSIVNPHYQTISGGRGGCKTCRNTKLKKINKERGLKIQDVLDAVNKRGGKLLSSEYKNIDSTLEFECSRGHRFENTFSKIKHRNQWCPTCNKGSKSEEITRTTFEQLFGLTFPKYRPTWLKNDRGNRMEIDGYCKELNIGFEYQGIQHFTKDIYGKSLSLRIKDDKLKAKLCKDNGVKLFILDYTMDYSELKAQIKKQANKLKVKLPVNFDLIEVDIYRAYIRNDRIAELQGLLLAKNIKVLSKKYLGSNKKVNLECLTCGHKWEALGNAFFNSRKIAGCDKCSRKLLGDRTRGNLSNLRMFAKQFNGELVSYVYVQSKYPYVWKCHKGHIFEGIYSNMKFRNQFCPKCEGRIIKNPKNKGLSKNP